MSPLSPSLGNFREIVHHPKVKRAAGAALALLLLDLILLAAFWIPSAARHHRLKGEIDGYRRATLEARRAEETAARYALLLQRALVLEAKWGKPTNQSDLIQSLTRLAAKHGLKVVSQDFDAVDSKGAGKIFKQNLTLAGTYPHLRGFLEGVESLPSLTVVEQTRLERMGDDGNQLRALLLLFTFHKPSGRGS